MTAVGDISVTLLSAGPSVSSQLFGSALIGLREGLEAAIVVTILVAFLVKSNRRDALKWVWLGVGAAVVMTIAVFLVIQLGQNTISGLGAEAIAGVASVIAVAIVTTMVIWMKKAAAGMSGELRSDMARALETGSLAVCALAFLAVGREGVETALFMVGFAEAKTLWPLTGLIVGVLIAVAIAYGMYVGALRINLAKFFSYTGTFLVVVAAGILSYGLGALQTVGWLPGLSNRAFDISSWLNWSSWYGQVIQGVFNVTPTPTVLQFSGWLAYLVIVLFIFLRPSKAPAKPAETPPSDTPPSAPTSTARPPRKVHFMKLSANGAPQTARAGIAVAAALLTGISMTGCQAKESETPAAGGPAQITVDASDSSCELSGTESATGATTFNITNNGSKVTEFYVYGAGDRVMGEVENISPGLDRKLIVQLTEPGTYQTACKPGMIGDGLRADFTVTGDAVQIDTEGKFKEAADNYKRYVNSQTEALIPAVDVFVTAIKKGDIPAAKAQFPIARTYYERIEPVAESFPDDLDPRIDLREADLEPGQKWTGFHALEKQLWVTGLQPDAGALADQLVADVKELNFRVKAPDFTVDSTQIAGGAQGLLDEISSSKITGEEDIFSHTDLWDFFANLQGSQTAVASVRPILDERNPDLGKKVDQRFTESEALVEKYRQGDGFVSYDTVTEPQRQELSRSIDALSKEVSQVQGVIAGQ